LAKEVAQLQLDLRNEREINSRLAKKNDNAIETKSAARSSIPRTCTEARLADPTLTSGMHWIDPDGQGVGDDPIYVYCNTTTGKKGIEKALKKKIQKNYFAMQDRHPFHTTAKSR
jgi:hypothetical protein